ncbi:MAG TPA: argininosuccinate lyase [Thermoanaerobaculia bacterium]|nr:argininosuccinate lyase [Thermoanaerobaculia bacterium]
MTNRMWGGRFDAAPSELLRALNDSFSFDHELFAHDVEGSMAWAKALHAAGVLTPAETASMTAALSSLTPPSQAELDQHEDVHSFVESKLGERIGALAGKLHTGRSRNDQVATDLRLWLRAAADECAGLLTQLARTLAQLGLDEAGTPMPGYTHSKQAEPVTFGHWCLAYVAMLQRDLSRLLDARARGNECPLGSAALSGTPLPVDRDALAKSLGFDRATASSLDGVGDRDFAAEYLFTVSLLLSHLSRLAEDVIFFSSDEARYVELPDALATGSSRMPQKKNPDVLELVRGHAGRSIGEVTGMLALLKGLPLAYDKDLQLDKEPLFRTRRVVAAMLPALTALMAGLQLNRERMAGAASSDLLLATELADAMAARGVPFRQAHDIVSARIGEALKRGVTLRELGPSESITAADLEALDVRHALSKRAALGGTSPERVREAAQRALAILK